MLAAAPLLRPPETGVQAGPARAAEPSCPCRGQHPASLPCPAAPVGAGPGPPLLHGCQPRALQSPLLPAQLRCWRGTGGSVHLSVHPSSPGAFSASEKGVEGALGVLCPWSPGRRAIAVVGQDGTGAAGARAGLGAHSTPRLDIIPGVLGRSLAKQPGTSLLPRQVLVRGPVPRQLAGTFRARAPSTALCPGVGGWLLQGLSWPGAQLATG